MIDKLKQLFPQLDACITICKNKNTYIFENELTKKGEFVSKEEKHHLHIENNINSQLCFVQNDNCIMINVKNGQCDYLVFNTKELYFIEVKVTKDNLSKYKRKAYKQIENTFKFYSNHLSFSNELKINALVCLPYKSNIIQPSKSTKRKEFKVNYNIDLKEGNYILFE